MTADLALRQTPGLDTVRPNTAPVPDGVTAIELWARTAEAAAGLVERLIDSPFVPAAFRPNGGKSDPRATGEQREQDRQIAVATATAAVLYGGEIGLSPMQALSNVIVIKGRPSLYAETMVALVQAAGHEVWTEEVTDTRARVCGRRAGSQRVEEVTFTIERARTAGYVASNTKYKTDPQSMLYARAASICCRRVAPEVLKGIPVAEELLDEKGDDAPAPAPAPRTAQRATRRRAAPAAAATAAELPAPAAAGPPPLPGEDGYDQAGADKSTGEIPDQAALDSEREGWLTLADGAENAEDITRIWREVGEARDRREILPAACDEVRTALTARKAELDQGGADEPEQGELS
jgi:hypothetical protein